MLETIDSPQQQPIELIICTVCKNEVDYLNLNIQISPPKNINYKWIIAYYDQKQDIENKIRELRKQKDKEKEIIFLERETQELYLSENILDERFEKIRFRHIPRLSSFKYKSTEHSINLTNAIKYGARKYSPRFILALDPDFFILYNIEEIIDRMKQSSLEVFGAPYPEKITTQNKGRIRDIPTAFCSLFDTSKFPVEEIKYTTGYGDYVNLEMYPDTGYELYNKIKSRGINTYDIAVPYVQNLVFTPNIDIIETNILNILSNNLDTIPLNKEEIIPEDVLPKYRFTDKGLKERYNIDIVLKYKEENIKIREDEYFYNNKCFGIHIRGKMAKYSNKKVDKKQISAKIKKQQELILSIYNLCQQY